MASIADFPAKDMTWDSAVDKGVFSLMQASHPKGYIALQLPPATLAFDVEDSKSHYAPRMKLRVSGDLVDWLRALHRAPCRRNLVPPKPQDSYSPG